MTVAVLPNDNSDNRQKVFVGETIGKNSYMNPKFDITVDVLYDAGYEMGDTFDVEVAGKTIHDAVLSPLFMGTFMFDTYLNIEKDQHLAAGMMWNNVLSNQVGNKVTITYTGHNDDFDKLNKFLIPLVDDRSLYDSDEAFANFYEVTGGDIKPGKLYRSFTPFGEKNRSVYVNQLAQDNNIKFDVALSYEWYTIPISSGYVYMQLVLDDKYVAHNLTTTTSY